MKKITEAWDDIYNKSTKTAKTRTDDASRFHKDKSSLNLVISEMKK